MNELDAFLELTQQRLPTAEEIIGICGALQIHFRVANGRPVLSGGADSRAIRTLMAKLISREPWRSQVIERTGLTITPPAPESDGWDFIQRELEKEKSDIPPLVLGLQGVDEYLAEKREASD